MSYTIVKSSSIEDQAKVRDFINDHFFPDLPVIPTFGIENNSPPETREKPKQSVLEAENIYLKAVDSSGLTIGVAVNRIKTEFSVSDDDPPQVTKIKEFFRFAEEKAELYKLPEKTIELSVLSVRQEWRNRGIARELTEESMKAAREAGFKAMKVCCTSEFTAKLARRLGWREHYRLAYKDYPRLSGTDICLKPTPPHEYVYYYATEL